MSQSEAEIDLLQAQLIHLEVDKPDSIELAECLEHYAKTLKRLNLRLLDAANMTAKAKALREKIGQKPLQQGPAPSVNSSLVKAGGAERKSAGPPFFLYLILPVCLVAIMAYAGSLQPRTLPANVPDYAFKQFHFGMTREEVCHELGRKFEPSSFPEYADVAVGEMPGIHAQFNFVPTGGKDLLCSIELEPESCDGPAMVDAFKVKYGKPNFVWQAEGDEGSNAWTWQNGKQTIKIMQLKYAKWFTTLSDDKLDYAKSEEEGNKRTRERNQKAVQNASDL